MPLLPIRDDAARIMTAAGVITAEGATTGERALSGMTWQLAALISPHRSRILAYQQLPVLWQVTQRVPSARRQHNSVEDRHAYKMAWREPNAYFTSITPCLCA